MITKDYNPSPIEVKFVEAMCELKDQIEQQLGSYNVTKVESNTKLDNPTVNLFLKDADGDEHELIVKVIQKPDKN